MKKVTAFQIAKNIDMKKFRKEFTEKELYSNNFEAFYGNEFDQFFYVQSYGIVVFSGYDELHMSRTMDYLKQFSKSLIPEKLREDFNITLNKEQPDVFGYNEIQVSQMDNSVMRIIMMYVGESVALDYYNQQSDLLLTETNKYTQQLEHKGRLDISGLNLKKFIGKILNIKNSITDSLYILDSPEETWENEYLSKLDNGLQTIFDVKLRHKEIDYKLQTIKENLELFKDLLQHRRANQLEIIIIALFVFEILNTLIDKLWK